LQKDYDLSLKHIDRLRSDNDQYKKELGELKEKHKILMLARSGPELESALNEDELK
jgi:hypothetical protein